MREQDIDDLFAAARAQTPSASADLMAKVFADAVLHQPQPSVLPIRSVPQKRRGFWTEIIDALGGKGAVAGLGTAAVVGVMLGFVQPTSLATLTDTLFAQTPLDELDLIPGVDAILTEG